MRYLLELVPEGFEDDVRARLGVDEEELPDSEINKPLIVGLAESQVKKRLPGYGSITDPYEVLFMQNAILSYICYLLCPTMARRVNTEVTTLDVKWKKDKVDWVALAKAFLAEYESSIYNIASIEVVRESGDLLRIAVGGRNPIGGE